VSDDPTPPPARRLTAAARAKLNELIKSGAAASDAMRTVSSEPGAFEEVTAPPPPPPPPPRLPWKGDTTDWAGVVAKLDRLRELDTSFTVFGARTHEYRLAPPLTEREVAALEKKWKVKLPPGLRAFYTQVGNDARGSLHRLARRRASPTAVCRARLMPCRSVRASSPAASGISVSTMTPTP
jgi:hypothetical protein